MYGLAARFFWPTGAPADDAQQPHRDQGYVAGRSDSRDHAHSRRRSQTVWADVASRTVARVCRAPGAKRRSGMACTTCPQQLSKRTGSGVCSGSSRCDTGCSICVAMLVVTRNIRFHRLRARTAEPGRHAWLRLQHSLNPDERFPKGATRARLFHLALLPSAWHLSFSSRASRLDVRLRLLKREDPIFASPLTARPFTGPRPAPLRTPPRRSNVPIATLAILPAPHLLKPIRHCGFI